MNEQPIDVDLSKLSKYLGKSMKIMRDTEIIKPNARVNEGGSNNHPDPYADKELPDLSAEYIRKMTQPVVEGIEYDEAAIENSNLPPIVKQAMLENIKQQRKLQAENAPKEVISETPRPQQKPLIKETVPTNHLGSREEIKSIVREVLSEMMMTNLSETVVKQTLRKMMTEGKLKVNKK